MSVDIHDPQRMIHGDFSDLLTFLLASPSKGNVGGVSQGIWNWSFALIIYILQRMDPMF